jgi:hypothetical protein
MATVHTTGDPNEVGPEAIKALYGAVFTHKFALKKQGKGDFQVQPLRGRWSNDPTEGKENLEGTWGLPIPEGTTELPQKVEGVTVGIERWEYGPVIEILHVGPYAEERPTIDRLLAFAAEQGLEVAGDHEEEYLTRPDAKAPKTLIRYRVRPHS